MSKKIFYYIIILLAFTACDNEQQMIFEENPSTRIADRKKAVNDILLSSDKGWKMLYFPKLNHNLYSDINLNMINLEEDIFLHLRRKTDFGYGGYTFFVLFEDGGKLKMASDFNFKEELTSGTYNLLHNTDLAISFTSGNIIHKLKGSGFEGKSDFIISSISDERIVLRTSKYLDSSNEFIVLDRIKETENWHSKLKAYKNIKEEFEKMRDPYLIIKNVEGEVVFRSNTFLRNDIYNPTGVLDTYKRYILFLKVDEGSTEVKVTYLHGVGSGFSYDENGINFKPGIKYNNDVMFNYFKRIGKNKYRSESNGFIANIIEITK